MAFKRLTYTVCILLIYATTPLRADNALEHNASKKTKYTYVLSDEDQKHVATGIYLWGFVLTAAAFALGLFIPNDPSSKPKTNATAT